MKTRSTRSIVNKLPLTLSSALIAALGIFGCDQPDHPSKMVEMRSQLQQQQQQMRAGGNMKPGAPPSGQPTGSTGAAGSTGQ